MEDHYRAQGFAVAGFYSNDFGKQGGSDEQIAEVTAKHGVKHDQYAMAPVIGNDARPAWKWLISQKNPGPKEGSLAPQWNFYKYLISRTGELIAAYDNSVYPGRKPDHERWSGSPLIEAIEAELNR
jgi:glutathione peroxidase